MWNLRQAVRLTKSIFFYFVFVSFCGLYVGFNSNILSFSIMQLDYHTEEKFEREKLLKFWVNLAHHILFHEWTIIFLRLDLCIVFFPLFFILRIIPCLGEVSYKYSPFKNCFVHWNIFF